MADIQDVMDTIKAVVVTALLPPTITISGSITAGDVLAVTAIQVQGPSIAFSYTTIAGDTPATAAAGLATAFTNAVPYLASQVASVTDEVVTLTLPGGPWTLSVAVSGAETEALTIGEVPGPRVIEGEPIPDDLDQIIALGSEATPIVSIRPRDHSFRPASRYPKNWQELPVPAATVTATVSSQTTVTLGGAAPGSQGPVQNLGVLIKLALGTQAFVYQTKPTDTLQTAAAGLAAVCSEVTPASAAGDVITVPAAITMVARVGPVGMVVRELRRQRQVFDVKIACADNPTRKTIGQPIRDAFKDMEMLVTPDGFAGQIRCVADYHHEDSVKIGLFSRCISFDVEYATTEARPAATIVAFVAELEQGTSIADSPSVNVPV